MDSSSLEESYEVTEADEIFSTSFNIIENDESQDSYQKPTFKNTAEAKKRLKAFAQQKQVPISPKALINCTEKSPGEIDAFQELSIGSSRVKKEYPMDRAKATVDEIELLKMNEEFSVPIINQETLALRSRSKSSEFDFVFRKRDKKIRNYRRSDNFRRSPSPTITTAKEKKSKHSYPKNWEEFSRDKWTFEKLINKKNQLKNKPSSSNDISQQLMFETPSSLIKTFHYKNERGEEIAVPHKFLRYTSAKPKLAYNANIFKGKEPFLTRQQVLDKTRKDFKSILEKFYSRRGKRFKTSEPMGQRNWYHKNWKDANSKVLETSIGLSFLQTYSDDEEEEEDQQLIDTNVLIESIINYPGEKHEEKDQESNKSLKKEQVNSLEGKKKKKHEKKTKSHNEFDITARNSPLHEEEFKDSTTNEIKHKVKRKRSISPDTIRDETKLGDTNNEIKKSEEDTSWTPERKPFSLVDMWPETSKKKKRKASDVTEVKTKIKIEEFDIGEDEKIAQEQLKTPRKDKKKKKRSKHDDESHSSSSQDGKKSRTKKKKKATKKKKEKEKKSGKKVREKSDMSKKEKKKQKEKKKKEILKKLKKEIEKKLIDEELIPSMNERNNESIKVKIEKEDDYENIFQLPLEIEKSLKNKVVDYCGDNTKILNEKGLSEKEKPDQSSHSIVKKEKIIEETKKQKEVKEERTPSRDHRTAGDQHKTKRERNSKKDEIIPGEVTPDTEEYQSNWESDEGISPFVKQSSKKSRRGWESDEEVFERSFSRKEPTDVPFGKSPTLEMPLDIKFPRRRFSRQEKKRSRTRSPEFLDMDKEIKLLEAERVNLNKERMQLEMEKIRIHELERKKSMEEMAEFRAREDSYRVGHNKMNNELWQMKEVEHESNSKERRPKDETVVRENHEVEKSTSSPVIAENSNSSVVLIVHSSPEISSTKSPSHTGLESAYQEFMRAVSGGDQTNDIVISSEDSDERHLAEESAKRSKVKYAKSRRDKNREKMINDKKIVSTTDPQVLQDILLPDEIPMPELPPPVPAPVPSPQTDLTQNLMPIESKDTSRLDQEAEEKDSDELSSNQQPCLLNSSPMKPFTFSTLVIPSEKSLLLEKSNWKLDDDSEEEVMPYKSIDDIKLEHEAEDAREMLVEENREETITEVVEKEDSEQTVKMPDEKKREEHRKEKEKRRDVENYRRDERCVKRKHSRSRSPLDSRDKRRKEDDRRREDERRRDSGHRRGEEFRRNAMEEEAKRRERNRRPTSPPRHREPSPRRKRSPVHRRSSPRYRSPPRRIDSRRPERGDRRSSPSKRRRSYSPPRPSPALRRKSPSPRPISQHARMSKSPRRSPMEGLKRSVADSTISDDQLPQSYAVDSSSSPLCSSTPAPVSRRSRLNLSPKRPSLDERINQVLGIEAQPEPAQAWKPTQSDHRQNVSYSGYHHHESLREARPPSGTPQMSKVLQVGNILQVVPSDDLCIPTPPQPVQAPPPTQKILQVGNMLQIVPSEMEPILPPLPPPDPPKEPLPPPEKVVAVRATPERQSAEDVLVGRMAERNRKRLEKEERRKEKEKKKKDKDKKKKMKLKVSTEEMIKRALELDGYIGSETDELGSMVPEVISESPGLDPSRSILSSSASRFLDSTLKTDRERKSVQFADGVRPGEGTSPSGGEELSSPPPQTDVLLKPKKLKKFGSKKKKKKRKTKVKVLRKPAPPPPNTASDDEYEILPPPSPPPGSPPPTVFPPRAKVHTINNIPQHYLPSYGITTAPQTPPMVPPQPRINLPYQTPPTAMYSTPPPQLNVASQHYHRMGHAPTMSMSIPPPPAPMHQDQPRPPYGRF